MCWSSAEVPDEYPSSQKNESFGELNRNKRGYEITAGITRLEEARQSRPKP
jgi:hypothetical protein